MTVLGPIASGEMGSTLTHEHFFVNMLRDFRVDGWMDDYDLIVREVQAFVAAAGRTIIEVSSNELRVDVNRDPTRVRQIAKDTGLNVIMGSGHYRDPYLDRAWFDRHTVDQIAERIVKDIEQGVADTGVQAGIIGEIGAEERYISAIEERSFRAAARAYRRTNLTITTHAARWPLGIPQLNLLEEESVDPRRVIIGHCDSVPVPEYHLEIARRGAYVQFDNVSGVTEYDVHLRVDCIMRLVREGYLDRILLSHDVCKRSQLHIMGGSGYDYIPVYFLPQLLEAGLSESDIAQIFIENPRRAVTGNDGDLG